MYKNKNLIKSFEDINSEDDFDICNTETGEKFAIKWSPPEDVKLFSKHRINTTQHLSRSVPRRKRSLFRYGINRSLNFEIGTARHEANFKSPGVDSDESPVYNEKYLTRSAKILRSLNINFSPLNARSKKINKTLNFDSSPSPKKICSSVESLCNKESPNFHGKVKRNTKINKTLNFSSSSNSSHLASCLGSSFDSIDENQNQTPSHRSGKVKKSLNYLTPSPKHNANLDKSINKTPMSREEFINNLKYNAETPNYCVIKQSEKKSKHFDGIGVSTPRNLFQDFEDEDKDKQPTTPENVVQFVAESMSAIKKSHKKQRQSKRLELSYALQLKGHCDQTETTPEEDSLMFSHSEERPATPITNDSYPSPNYSVGSIKQSHKKDKSMKRNVLNYSEDEISDSGSIFDYTELLEMKPDAYNDISFNSENNLRPLSKPSSGFQIISSEINHDNKSMCPDNSIEEFSNHGSLLDNSEPPEIKHLPCAQHAKDQLNPGCQVTDQEPLKLSFHKLELISPGKIENTNNTDQGRPVTPQNVINVLEQVMTDSIKKSHKKIKDKNKKSLLKFSAIRQDVVTESPESQNDQEAVQDMCARSAFHTPEKVARAGTPENVNSSRLLLGQYSSVKKSHKKNKHKKIVTESTKRQKYFNNDDPRHTATESDNISTSLHNTSGTSTSKRRNSERIEGLVGTPVTGNEIYTVTPDKRSANNRSVELFIADSSPLERSTPNKRKKSFSLNETGGTSTSSVDLTHIDSSSLDYESAEEEFKIFTPIKKRRSLRVAVNAEEISVSLQEKPPHYPDLQDRNCSIEDGSFKSTEYSFTTPNRSRDTMADGGHNYNSESRVCGESSSANENSNGRSTPQNRSTSDMVFDVNSIKKSHKKDKKNSQLRRTVGINNEKNGFQVIKVEDSFNNLKSSACRPTGILTDSVSVLDSEECKPSTSYGSTAMDSQNMGINKTSTTWATEKTPPNCSKVVHYLKLRQADSIKRSHKKTREQKRQRAILNDPDLSDDGSIFDSSDWVEVIEENASIVQLEGENSTGHSGVGADTGAITHSTTPLLTQTPPNTSKLVIQIESIKKSHKKVREFKRIGTRDVDADLSGEGPISCPDERLDKTGDTTQ